MSPLSSALSPWRRNQPEPFASFERSMNRMFEDFYKDWDIAPFKNGGTLVEAFAPRVDIAETAEAMEVSAEIPGMDEKDVEVTLHGDLLTIKGEKKEEKEEKKKDYYRMERSYGSFQRVVPLPCEVQADKVEAKFKNGVLSITLPKTAEAQKSTRKIQIKAG